MERAQVEDLLLKAGVFVGMPGVRFDVATALSNNPKFGEHVLDTLLDHCRHAKLGLGFLAKSLRGLGWMDLYDDVVRQQQLKQAEREKEPAVEFATPDNPAGWPHNRMLPVLKTLDHNTPNTWNAYRRSYNGPNGQKTQTCTLKGHEGKRLSPLGGLASPESVELEPWRVGLDRSVASVQAALQALTDKATGKTESWSW